MEVGLIGISDFLKVQMRVALVESAKDVKDSNKLLSLILDAGDKKYHVFAGIKKFYAPNELVGRLVVMVANLEPRKMSFGVSEAMILAASNDRGIHLISPDSGAIVGMRVS